MAKDAVQELIVRIKNEGLGNLEFLKKELKQVSSQSKISEGSIDKLQKEIKQFGDETKKTTEGLKGQISAFQKLRAQTGFQGQAYQSLTNDIFRLNKELERRLGIERELDRMGSGRASRSTPPPGDEAMLKSSLKKEWTSGGVEQFAQRQAAFQSMLIGRTFENLTKKQQDFLNDFKISLTKGTYDVSRLRGKENAAFKALIDESNTAFLASSEYGPGGKMLLRGDHKILEKDLTQKGKLNDIQKAALNITDDLAITSQKYLDVLTKINAETKVQANQLSSADAFSEMRGALARSDIRTTTDLKAQQDARIKSFLYQDERATYDSKATTSTFRKAGIGPAEKKWKEGQFQWVQDIQAMLGMVSEDWQAPGYKAMLSEMDRYPRAGKKRDQVRLDRTDIRAYEKTYGQFQLPIKLDAQRPHIEVLKRMGEGASPLRIKDPMGLGADPKYPRTEFGLGEELKNLVRDLPNLENGTKPWLDLVERIAAKKKEINELVEEGTKALKARQHQIAKEVNPKYDQKLLPAAGQTSGKYTVKQLEKRIADSYAPTQFTPEQYGPQLETQDQLIKRLQTTIKARKSSIKTISEHRSKLEEIRRTLIPTSAKFKSIAKSIEQADKSLAKLNKTSSKGFGKKGLLGFGQSVLGGAYFGGPFGAVGAGIGQIFGGAGGAATGGLVGAQVGRPISDFVGGSATYASGIAKSQIALKKAAGDGDSYAKAMEAAQFAIERLNVPQEVAIRGMTRLSAAVVGAGGNIDNAAEAFISITSAIKGTAGGAEDVKAAITAMVQIFSKGKVSAEELSGQLGERFPAAVVKFAEANKLNAEDLQKRLKEGTVGLDMLSKFVASLGKEFLPVALEIAGSSEEAGARLQIMFRKIRLEVGNSLKEVGAELQVMAAQLVRDALPAIIEFAKKSGEVLLGMVEALKKVIRFFKDWGDLLVTFASAAVIGKVIGAIQLLSFSKFALLRVVAKLKTAWVGLNLTMLNSPLFKIAAAVTAVGWAYTRAQRNLKSFTNGVLDGTKSMEDADKKIAELKEGLEKIEEAQKAGASGNLKKLRGIDEKLGMGRNFTLIGGERDQITYGDLRADELSNAITLLEDAKRAANGAAIDIDELLETMFGNKAKFKGLTKGGGGDGGGESKSPFASFAEELDNFDNALEQVGVNGFKKLEDSILQFARTGKLAIKDLVKSVLDDLQRLMIRQSITKPLFNAFTNALTGGGLDWSSNNPNYWDTDMPIPNAKGNAFANNKIVPYRKGGVVHSPTMFKYGGANLGIMGESGPEAILPLQRGRGGRLGVAMHGGRGGGGSTTVNYTGPTLNFNGDEYVPKSAVGDIINTAAARGAKAGEVRTLSTLQHSRSKRSTLGL
tara:strand:- start:820 stop:4893 length:4074 start_codon:yes stop_codon:yes gene_type:complete